MQDRVGRKEQDSTENDNSRQNRAGQDRAGKGRTKQDRMDRTGQNRKDRRETALIHHFPFPLSKRNKSNHNNHT